MYVLNNFMYTDPGPLRKYPYILLYFKVILSILHFKETLIRHVILHMLKLGLRETVAVFHGCVRLHVHGLGKPFSVPANDLWQERRARSMSINAHRSMYQDSYLNNFRK